MKIKLMMLGSLLVVISAYTCGAQVGPSKPNGPVSGKDVPDKLPPMASKKMPDLVVVTIKGDNLDNGQVSVMVRNLGKGASDRSDMELKVSFASQPPVSLVHAVPPMPANSWEIVTIDLKQSIVQAAFCATVDSMKAVTESNEKNNRRCGKFGGKP